MPLYGYRIRRNLATVWTSKNPVLSEGEQGLELDTGKFKIGNGVTVWNALPYFIPDGATHEEVAVAVREHELSETPHPVYDEGPSLTLLYENARM